MVLLGTIGDEELARWYQAADALLPAVADAASLAGAMRELATDPGLRERLRAGGRALLPQFAWRASARRHLEVYAEVRAASSHRRIASVCEDGSLLRRCQGRIWPYGGTGGVCW